MNKRYERFLARLKHEVDSQGHGSMAYIANHVGCTGAFIGQILKKGTKKKASIAQQIKIGEFVCNSDERFIDEGDQILNYGCIQAEKQTIQKMQSYVQERKNERHHIIIDEFKNHDLAIEINSLLVEFEKLEDSQGLIKIKEFIEYQLNKAKTGTQQNPLIVGKVKGG